MPKCYGCRESVPSDDLKAVGEELFCSGCRELRSEPARAEEPKKEVTMSKDRKAIASIQVFPNDIEDDYDIEGFIRVGGVKIEIDTNMNRLRDFFTKRRAKRDRLLKAEVYRRDPSKAVPVEDRS